MATCGVALVSGISCAVYRADGTLPPQPPRSSTAATTAKVQQTASRAPTRVGSHNLARAFFISIACDVRQNDSRLCHEGDDGDVLQGAGLSFPPVYSPSGSVATTCFANPRGSSARVLQRQPTRELVDVTTRSRLP